MAVVALRARGRRDDLKLADRVERDECCPDYLTETPEWERIARACRYLMHELQAMGAFAQNNLSYALQESRREAQREQ